jgi:hypothetical protein
MIAFNRSQLSQKGQKAWGVDFHHAKIQPIIGQNYLAGQ